MRNFFMFHKYYLFGLIFLAIQAQAMHDLYREQRRGDAAFTQLCGTLLVNQSLQQQFLELQQQIQYREIDDLVSKAKHRIAEQHAQDKEAILCIQAAAEQNHVEALHLTGKLPKEGIYSLQLYRLQKGLIELSTILNLLNGKQGSERELICHSEAYERFKEILDQEIHSEQEDEPIRPIRGAAAYNLGYMCLNKLGVPTEEATTDAASKYYKQALELGEPNAAKALELLGKKPTAAPIPPSQVQEQKEHKADEPSKNCVQQTKSPNNEQQQSTRATDVQKPVEVIKQPAPQDKNVLQKPPVSQGSPKRLLKLHVTTRMKPADQSHNSYDRDKEFPPLAAASQPKPADKQPEQKSCAAIAKEERTAPKADTPARIKPDAVIVKPAEPAKTTVTKAPVSTAKSAQNVSQVSTSVQIPAAPQQPQQTGKINLKKDVVVQETQIFAQRLDEAKKSEKKLLETMESMQPIAASSQVKETTQVPAKTRIADSPCSAPTKTDEKKDQKKQSKKPSSEQESAKPKNASPVIKEKQQAPAFAIEEAPFEKVHNFSEMQPSSVIPRQTKPLKKPQKKLDKKTKKEVIKKPKKDPREQKKAQKDLSPTTVPTAPQPVAAEEKPQTNESTKQDVKEKPTQEQIAIAKEQKKQKDKKKSPEKKTKDETPKTQKQSISKEQEKEECKKAYSLLTNLIDYYYPADAATIKADLLTVSDNWKTALATYKGACSLLANKCNKEKRNVSRERIIGILNYLMGNFNQAKEIFTCSSYDDPVTAWYQVLTLIEIEQDVERADLKESLTHLLLSCLPDNDNKNIQRLLVKNEKSDEFVEAIDFQNIDPARRLKLLRLKLLLGNEKTKKAAEAIIVADHEKGAIDASIYLARRCIGTGGEESLPKALAVLKKSIELDKDANNSREELLNEIAKIAEEKKDINSYLYANYLAIIDYAKIPNTIKIYQLLDSTEKKIQAAPKNRQTELAKLLNSSGACEKLIPIAQNDSGVAFLLNKIIIRHSELFNVSQQEYSALLQVCEPIVTKLKNECCEAVCKVHIIIQQYLNETLEKQIVTKLNQKTQSWLDAKEVYNDVFDILAALEQSQGTAEIMAILLYLAGNVKGAKEFMANAKDSKKPALFTELYSAIILLATEPNTADRNQQILDGLKSLIHVKPDAYEQIKHGFVLKDELIQFIKKHLKTSAERIILARLALIFGCEKLGVTEKAIEQLLKKDHEDGSINASLCLTQMYAQGTLVKKSLYTALSIMQTIIESPKSSSDNDNILETLSFIDHVARRDKDQMALLHCSYLDQIAFLCCGYLNPAAYAKNEQGINDEMLRLIEATEDIFLAMDPSLKNVAAEFLKSSGAYKALIPLAQHNEEIRSKLFIIASRRVLIYNHSQACYDEIYAMQNKPEEKTVSANQQPHNVNLDGISTETRDMFYTMFKVFHYYLGSSTSELCTELFSNFKSSHATNVGVFTYEFCKNKFSSSDQQHPELMSVLSYRQSMNSNPITENWYIALLTFITNVETEDRNNEILELLKDSLFKPIDDYTPAIKQSLLLDKRFMEFIRKQALSNDLAEIIDARINVLFNNQQVGSTLRNSILEKNKKGIAAASLWLAQLYFSENNLPAALEVLQNSLELKKENNHSILISMLFRIGDHAVENEELISAIHANYLLFVQKLSHKNTINHGAICSELTLLEAQFKQLTDKSECYRAAWFLLKSGTYESLLSIADKHHDLATRLGDICCERIRTYNHPESDYSQALEIAARACTVDIERYKKMQGIKT